MRYPASDKLDIIQVIDQSHLSLSLAALEEVGIPRATFYRWYDP